MTTPIEKTASAQKMPRPPVVAVMGHIDHGKSTLLDYIRKTNIVAGEAGGITQHLGAYEVVHKNKEGKEYLITFLDTPGHEAFKGIRERGAIIADIAILVVSAEEGVKPQTLEALAFIKKTQTPFVVAITKVDKPQADIARTKQNLAEKEIYVEGYGGDVPCAAVSAKTGEGIDDLLDLIALVAELEELHADPRGAFEGYVIEAEADKKKGAAATLIVRSGTLRTGSFVVAEGAVAPTRQLENFREEKIAEAPPGTPVRVIGWRSLPRVGAKVVLAETKREAEERAAEFVAEEKNIRATPLSDTKESECVPLVIKADTGGSLEAVEQELMKLSTEKVLLKVVGRGLGEITESDAKTAHGCGDAVILGFNVGIDAQAKAVIERGGLVVGTFDIIYKLIEWVTELVKSRTPRVKVEAMKAVARVIKIFSTERDRQILGGKVHDGEISVGDEFKVFRRDAEIGRGRVRELQRLKEKTNSVSKDSEFGACVSANVEVMPMDRLEAFTITEQ